MFENAHREGRVSNLALQLAQRTPVGANPLLDYLIVSSDSVGQGLDRLTRYLRLVNPSVGLTVRGEGGAAVRVVVERAQTAFVTELTVSLCVIRFMRETDDQFRAAHVSFTREPDDVVEYARVLRCQIDANASWNGVVIPREAIALPLRRRDPMLRGWLERQAAAILVRMPASGDASDEVRSVLSTQGHRRRDDDRRGRPPRPARSLPAALVFGVCTSVFPWLLMFPAMGYGFFGAHGPEGTRLFLSSLVSHAFFGKGIWLAVRTMSLV